MHLIENKIRKIPTYFLPLSLFFILISSAATNFFILLSVLSAIIFCIQKRHLNYLIEKKSMLICIIIFISLAFSSLYSIAEYTQIIEVLKKYIKFLYIPILYYLVKIYDNKYLLIKFFLYGCSIILLFSYLKFFSIFEFEFFYDFLEKVNLANVKEKIVENKTAIFQHYIIQGIVLSFYSFLCLYLGIKNKSKIYFIFSGLAFINVLFMNDSRTAYILIICLLFLGLFTILKNSKAIISILIILASLFFSQFSENLERRFEVLNTDFNYIQEGNYNSSLGLRFIWFKVGSDILKNKPTFGYGVGSFKKSAENYYKKNNMSAYEKYVTNNPHNEFISISSQLGVFGLILYSGFILFLFYENRNNILGIAVAMTILISSIFNSAFYDNMLGLFLVIIICLTQKTKQKVLQ